MTDFEAEPLGAAAAGGSGERRSAEAGALASVIVGLDGREHDRDAMALGRLLQRALGGGLCLAHAIPPGPPGQGRLALESLERQDGARLLEHAASTAQGCIETELIGPSPAAEGLARLAATRHHSILVVGSSHRGPVGRIVPGGVASLLLARAPCPIAVAPAGYSELPHTAVNRIGVAYDRTHESDAALAAAAAAGARLSIPLRLYHARPASARDKVRPHVEELARDVIAAGLTALPPQLEATGVVLEGDAGEVIATAARDDDVGLLYVGSRGHGPLREAVFGGVTGSLLRAVHCPLIIVPRHS